MEKLGRYEILGELGRGGCGVVYRAIDPSIGRTVAIKTILAESLGDSMRERFRREARSAGILSHPNIVTIHEFNDTGDMMFIAMEFVDGQTLAQRMADPNLPLGFVLTTVRSAAEALDFAHASNIVHRDVKPANFIITKQGVLKITDFGIAKMLDSDVSLTNTGMVIGTVQYMSPEQISAQPVTGRSDQFSLAVIAYEMLTRQRPFQGNSWASMIHSIASTEPTPLHQYREDLGEAPTQVLRKALAKDAADRYPTCRDFADALERSILGATNERRTAVTTALLPSNRPDASANETSLMTAAMMSPSTTKEQHPVAATVVAPVTPPPPPKRSWAIPAAIGAVIAIGVAAWLGLRSGGSQPATPPPVVAQAPVKQIAEAPKASEPSPTPAAATPDVPPTPEPQIRPAESSAPVVAPEKPRSTKTETSQVKTAAVPAQTRAAAPRDVATPVITSPVITSPATSPAAAPTVSSVTPTQQPPVTQPVASTPVPSPASTQPTQSATVARVTERPTPPAGSAATPPPTATPAAPPPAVITPAVVTPKGPDPAELAAQRRTEEIQTARRAIANAVSKYRQAFETRDLDGLMIIWPALDRNERNSFQNFFRIARSIRLQMTPLGEPEITATGATARYRRTLNATDERRALPAQDQTVKITFRKAGDQMLIDSIEAVAK